MRYRMMFIFVMLGLFTLPTLACGGFFCTTTPIDQNAERIIFTVNGDGTMTAVVGINYVGDAEDFSWVVPVPSPPEVGVAETASLDMLQSATNKNIRQPKNYCDGLLYTNGGRGGGGDYLEAGSVGPYDYHIIGSEDPNELITWLRDNGYQVTEAMEPIIADYVNDGMYFLAMKLSQDAEVGDIQPVTMTYNSTKPMIPLKLTAVAAVDNMPVIVWIFGEAQYIPENYAHPEVDYTTFRGPSQIYDVWNDERPDDDYFAQLRTIQSEYDGLAFVTEYAQPTSALAETVSSDELLADLTTRFPYMTRLRAQLSPEQMTLDPTFILAPDAEDVSNVVMLEGHVDPLHYWGCSTREIRVTDAEAILSEYVRLDEFMNVTHVGYPDRWVMSEVVIDVLYENVNQVYPYSIYIFAPETVDEARLRAVLAGEDDLPVFTVSKYRKATNEWSYNALHSLTDLLGLPRETDNWSSFQLPESVKSISNTHFHMYTSVDGEGYGAEEAVYLNAFAPAEKWEEYEPVLSAMVRYADSYQFFTHPELRHTLFLGGSGAGAAIGYPEGWIEAVTEDETVLITPEGEDAVRARFIPLTRLSTEEDDTMNTPLMEKYGLSEMDAERAVGGAIVPYELDGRKGYLKRAGYYLLDMSAPEADFNHYKYDFRKMLHGFMPDPTVNRYALG